MKKYNVGIIGYSWAAGAHIEAINKTEWARVTAVYSSRNLDPAELNTRHGGNIRCFTDLSQMLSDPEIHIVSITSYPADHAKQAIMAAKAGKHLIIEKPVALTWEDCLAVKDAVDKSGVKTCVCFECRYSSQFLTTKALIDSGLLGDIHYGEIDYYHGIGPWYGQYRWNIKKDSAGSSLLSAGCHALDALLLCMGTDVQEVSSFATRSKNSDFSKYEYPTTSVTLLKYKDGRIGKVASVIDCFQPYYFHVHLVGSEGSLLDNKFYSTKMGGLDRGKWSELSMKMLDSGDVSDHPYQTQFEAFFQALDLGRDMQMTSLAAALYTHEIIFKADINSGH
ncbi:MAG TPA: Gfo/Idh/MocA family oxidoreductase [Bacteroidales bacterium]|nr:Gfo/Idh/MocA family oxidoreductase [Bacteroidales bacterium]